MIVDWKSIKDREKVSQDKLIEIIKKLKKNDYAKSAFQMKDWLKTGTWRYIYKEEYGTLYVKEKYGFKIYYTNVADDNKNTQEITGKDAIRNLEEKFKELNNVGLKIAFGTTDEKFKLNIPRQFYYIKNQYKDRIVNGISAVDFTSHYPSNACGLLPDAHTIKEVNGVVKPNSEYPFAFYDSGHLAIYKEFDTHDWIYNTEYINSVLQQEVLLNKDTKTYLMKASKYSMDSTWQYFYNKRKDNANFKLVLNASIGFFHTKKYTMRKYAHLAAVIIARANNKMMKIANLIGFNNILHICIDGCIYKGKKQFSFGSGLGSLKQEHVNKSIYIKGCNQYIISELNQYDKCLEVKHGGFDARTDNKPLDKADYIKDIELYYKINKEYLKDPEQLLNFLEGQNGK